MGCPSSLRPSVYHSLSHSQFLSCHWTDFDKAYLIASKYFTSSMKFVFFGPIHWQRWTPCSLIRDIFHFESATMFWQNLTGSKFSTETALSTEFVGFLVHLNRRLKCTIVITRCPSSVRLSVRPSSVVNFSHFRFLLWNRWTEFNKTWQEARSQRPLPSLCFFGPIGKIRWPPWPLIGWDIFDFFSETAERNSTKLDRKQDLNVLYQVCVFWAEGKTRWPPWPLIGWDIFDFSSETAERNSTKLDRQQDHNVLYQVCVFRADWKNKMAAVASDWLLHFRLLLWNRLMQIQRNLTVSKISMSFTKFVFFGPIGKTRWPPWPLIGWDIFDFSSETSERNSTKLDRKQDLNVLYQVCVFRADQKTKMAALADSSKRWHIVLRCTICGPLGLLFFFFGNWSTKMASLASDWLTHFQILLSNCWTDFD